MDQAALTGESLPVAMVGGDEAKMGSTAVRGEVSAIVKNTGAMESCGFGVRGMAGCVFNGRPRSRQCTGYLDGTNYS